ncbi:MAG: 6-phosphogluconolactonase [Bacteriovoracaceae bacterium]|nr:6-phosphogluconolactonase [Bacteriovoracaceae bacterium]
MNSIDESKLIARIIHIANDKKKLGQSFRFLVSGGNSIKSVLDSFSNNFCGEGTLVFIADERLVPIESTYSNTGIVSEILGPSFKVVDFYENGLPSLKKGEKILSNIESFDFALLGVGEDGHVCSLFPEKDTFEKSKLFVSIKDSPKPPKKRVTVTYELLKKCNEGALLIMGENKKHLITSFNSKANRKLPYNKILNDFNFFVCSDLKL